MNRNISVITINYNDAERVVNFVNKISNYSILNHIIIVDNNSTDDSLSILNQISNKKVHVISSGANKGYGYGNNCGIKFAQENFNSQYIVISNPDVYFHESTISKLCRVLENDPSLLMASAVMTDQNGKKQSNTAWKTLPNFKFIINEGALVRRFMKLDQYRDLFKQSTSNLKYVDCLAGSFFILKQNTLFESGVYDENMFLYCEEDYLGWKIKEDGYRAALLLTEKYIHAHGKTINKAYSKSKQDKLIFNNKIYLLKKYFNASNSMINFAKFFFSLCGIERFIGREVKYIVRKGK